MTFYTFFLNSCGFHFIVQIFINCDPLFTLYPSLPHKQRKQGPQKLVISSYHKFSRNSILVITNRRALRPCGLRISISASMRDAILWNSSRSEIKKKIKMRMLHWVLPVVWNYPEHGDSILRDVVFLPLFQPRGISSVRKWRFFEIHSVTIRAPLGQTTGQHLRVRRIASWTVPQNASKRRDVPP